MSQELSTEISPEIINSLILTGDMSKLTPGQQTQYYVAVCKDLGLNPLTQPFAIITLQGKKTLYATKGCTQQLANIRKIDTEVLSRDIKDSVYIVSVRASMPDGRKTDEDGIVGISGLKGTDLANAMLKAITKAKRRAVLALCGLGMPDESEVEDFNPAPQADTSKSKVEKIVNQVEEAEVVKNEVSKNEKKETKKVKETVEKSGEELGKENQDSKGDMGGTSIQQPLPEGHHQIQGVITDMPSSMPVTKEGKDVMKYIFKMGDLKLGTFDQEIFKGITDIMDLQKDTPILLNIEYKERKYGDKTFRDIVSFSQVTSKQVLI
jgi:hypothetical protein